MLFRSIDMSDRAAHPMARRATLANRSDGTGPRRASAGWPSEVMRSSDRKPVGATTGPLIGLGVGVVRPGVVVREPEAGGSVLEDRPDQGHGQTGHQPRMLLAVRC